MAAAGIAQGREKTIPLRLWGDYYGRAQLAKRIMVVAARVAPNEGWMKEIRGTVAPISDVTNGH